MPWLATVAYYWLYNATTISYMYALCGPIRQITNSSHLIYILGYLGWAICCTNISYMHQS